MSGIYYVYVRTYYTQPSLLGCHLHRDFMAEAYKMKDLQKTSFGDGLYELGFLF